MTTRRRLQLFALFVGVLALGVCAWLYWPKPLITAATCFQVHERMSLQDVEILFHCSASQTIPGPACGDPEGARDCSEVKVWPGIGGEIQIGFDQDQRVRGVIYWRSQATLFHRVRFRILAFFFL